jgi:hypothetical protein
MVKSKINTNVNYDESNEIDDEDIDYSSPLYDYNIFDKDILIALGKQRHTFSRNEIVFFPIYMIVNELPRAKIGIFEVESAKLIDIMDDDGDVKLSKKNIIIYANKQYISDILKKYEKEKHEKDEKDKHEKEDKDKKDVESIDNDVIDLLKDEDDVLELNIPEEKQMKTDKEASLALKDGVFIINDKIKESPLLKEESKEDSQELKHEFKEAPKNTWIQKLMKNTNYEIIDNEGGGDCFFAVIRDAFKQIGKETTVAKLRALIAKEATDKMFQESRSIYTGVLVEYQEKEREIKIATKTITLLKKRIENSKNKIGNKQSRNNKYR